MPSIAGGAILGAGALGAGASIYGANEQATAAENAQNLQWQMFGRTQQNLQPYMNEGTQALPMLNNLLGLGSQGAAGESAALAKTPGYQFALQQGLQGTQNGFAAQGLGSSGAAMKGAANYAEGLASTTYQQQVGNYMNLAGLGANAAAGVSQAGMSAGTNIGNAMMGAASAQAAGLSGAAGSLGNSLALAGMMNGGGGGGMFTNQNLGQAIENANPGYWETFGGSSSPNFATGT